jgi:hypothetical protein
MQAADGQAVMEMRGDVSREGFWYRNGPAQHKRKTNDVQ